MRSVIASAVCSTVIAVTGSALVATPASALSCVHPHDVLRSGAGTDRVAYVGEVVDVAVARNGAKDYTVNVHTALVGEVPSKVTLHAPSARSSNSGTIAGFAQVDLHIGQVLVVESGDRVLSGLCSMTTQHEVEQTAERYRQILSEVGAPAGKVVAAPDQAALPDGDEQHVAWLAGLGIAALLVASGVVMLRRGGGESTRLDSTPL